MSMDDYLLDQAETEIRLILETAEDEEDAFNDLMDSSINISPEEAEKRIEKYYHSTQQKDKRCMQ
jgi:hypothetical protein